MTLIIVADPRARTVFDVRGMVVLVTGGSRGIGRAIVRELSEAGAEVAVHYRKEADRARSLVTEAAARGSAARAFEADLRDPPAAGRLVSEVMAWRGRLDGLVTSAGVFRGDALPEIDRASWDAVMSVDLEGSFRTIQAAVPHLSLSPRASIVTVSSVLASHPAVGGSPYQAAKAGMEQMTRALALELAPKIRVNSVAPGFIRTDMNRDAHSDPEFSHKVARATPLGRWGEPEDVAPVVRYLLSSDASWVTGAVVAVDGGIPLR